MELVRWRREVAAELRNLNQQGRYQQVLDYVQRMRPVDAADPRIATEYCQHTRHHKRIRAREERTTA